MSVVYLADKAPTIGFRSSTTLDETDGTMRRVRVAVKRAKDGDADAIRYLYVVYSDNIYGYVRSIVRDEHDAEDVTQQVFAKLITAIAKYDDRGVPFFAWLLRMSRNVAIDHLRRNRVQPMSTEVDPEACSGADLDSAETVREALATLPHEQRRVVFMRHVMGLSPVEIADRIGRSESAVHGLHHRGRRALQRELTRRGSRPLTRPNPAPTPLARHEPGAGRLERPGAVAGRAPRHDPELAAA